MTQRLDKTPNVMLLLRPNTKADSAETGYIFSLFMKCISALDEVHKGLSGGCMK